MARKTDKAGSARAADTTKGYDAADITVLEGLEAVRKRPGMYIGSTGLRGLHHLVYEVVDNSVDEALAGHCDAVEVTIHPDNSVTVVDDGRGIPVAMHEKEKRPAVEVVLTVLHSGGKFGDGGGYKVSGGLHGVGVSVVNALSESCRSRSAATGRRVDAELRPRHAARAAQAGAATKETGTTVTFLPDADIFESLDYDFDTLQQRLQETAFLTRGLQISLIDERGEGRRSSSATRAGSATSSRTSTRTRTRSRRRSSTSRARARRAPSRWRCSGTPPTRSRSSRSPTTSTPTRAARTCRAFGRP